MSSEEVYLWPVDAGESTRLSKLLECDFNSLNVSGHSVMRQRIACPKCGKLTGLDDLVHTALKKEAYDKDIIVNILKNRSDGDGREHRLYCVICDTLFTKKVDGEDKEATFLWKASDWVVHRDA